MRQKRVKQNRFLDNHKITKPPLPLPYQAWAREQYPESSAEELSSLMAKEETKRAYADYFLAGEVTFLGDWSLGMIQKENGSFHPFSTPLPFHEAGWDSWYQYESFFSNRSAAEELLWEYLRGEKPSIWGREQMVVSSQPESNGVDFSKDYGACFSFTYTVPPSEAGWISPYIRPSAQTEIHKSMKIVILHNDKPIWPDGAVLSDSDTWMKEFLCKESLYVSMEGLSLRVKAGDRIHFVLEGECKQRNLLDPVVLVHHRGAPPQLPPPKKDLVSRDGAAIPAMPDTLVDLWQYRVWIADEEVEGSAIAWMNDCKEIEAPIWRRYCRAPSKAGVYQLTARWKDQVIPVRLSVCDQNGEYPMEVLPHRADVHWDIEEAKAMRADIRALLGQELSYWCDTLCMVAGEVMRHRRSSKDLSEFFFISDTHHEINHQRSIPVANCLSDVLGIDRLIFGGDFMNGQDVLADSFAVRDAWLSLMDTFHGFWYPARGNHDINTASTPFSMDDFWTDADYHRYILQKSGVYSVQSGMRVVRSVCPGMQDKHGGTVTEPTEDCLFYYVDDEKARIRYYFLDDGCFGLLDEVGGRYDTSTHPRVNVIPYKEQLKWLQYTATTGDDALHSGWGLVVVEHRMFNPYPISDWTPGVSGCYKMLTEALHEILPRLTAEGVEIIAVLSGHTHWDADCQTPDGYPVIAITCDADYLGQKQERYALQRYAGSATEQAMDIVQIDRQNRRLFFTRIGSGVNRSFSYKGVE